MLKASMTRGAWKGSTLQIILLLMSGDLGGVGLWGTGLCFITQTSGLS